jgi:hypothetical protein
MITSPILDDLDAPPATRHPGIPLTGRHPAVTFAAQALARLPWHREVSPKAGPARRLACALPRGRRRRRATHLTGSISAILSAAAPWVAPGVATRGVVLLARHARRRAPISSCAIDNPAFDYFSEPRKTSMIANLKLVEPCNENRQVAPGRMANADMRPREYLTPAEIEKLAKAAKKGRWGDGTRR